MHPKNLALLAVFGLSPLAIWWLSLQGSVFLLRIDLRLVIVFFDGLVVLSWLWQRKVQRQIDCLTNNELDQMERSVRIVAGMRHEALERYPQRLLSDLDVMERLLTRLDIPSEERRTPDHLLERMRSNINALKNARDNIAKWERLQKGALRDVEKVDLKAVLAEIDSAVQLDRLRFHLCASRVIVNGDRELLKSAFENLINNALKFSRDSVDVSLTRDNEHAALVVTDKGIGIAKEEQANIWELFNRGSASASIDGTGVGLALVRAIIDRHQGSVDLFSQENVETIFTLKLPLEQQALVAPSTRNGPGSRSSERT